MYENQHILYLQIDNKSKQNQIIKNLIWKPRITQESNNTLYSSNWSFGNHSDVLENIKLIVNCLIPQTCLCRCLILLERDSQNSLAFCGVTMTKTSPYLKNLLSFYQVLPHDSIFLHLVVFLHIHLHLPPYNNIMWSFQWYKTYHPREEAPTMIDKGGKTIWSRNFTQIK